MSIHSNLLAVMKGLNKIDSSKMEFGRTKYAYLSENAVTPAVKELFEEHGLVIIPNDSTFENQLIIGKDGEVENILATVKIDYLICNVEDGETVTATGIGQGMDRGDKAIPKACTAALKQMFRHLLLIASPDRLDPDNTASDAVRPPKAPQTAEAVVKFGKYSGKTLNQILEVDRKYVEWIAGKEGEFQDAAKTLLG